MEPGLKVCALHYVPNKKFQASHVEKYGCLAQGARLHGSFCKKKVKFELNELKSTKHDHTYATKSELISLSTLTVAKGSDQQQQVPMDIDTNIEVKFNNLLIQ
jgi:hypothetical protein